MLDHGLHAEDRQVDGAGAVHRRTGSRDLLEQQRRLGDAEAVAAVLLGDRHAEPAAVGDGVVELLREFVRQVLFHPVVVVELAPPARRPTYGSAPDPRSARNSFHRRALMHSPLISSARAQCAGARSASPHRRRSDVRNCAQSLLPVSSLAFAAKSAKLAPPCSCLLQGLDGDVVALSGLAQRADGGLLLGDVAERVEVSTSASRSRRSSC